YSIVRGYHDNFRNACAPNSPLGTGTDRKGVMGVKGTMTTGGLSPGKVKITDIKDGTSNTIMVAESAGRHQVYVQKTAVSPNTPGSAGWALNAAWADYNTAIEVRGWKADINAANFGRDAGCTGINATNGISSGAYQIFSFHPGGANSLRADGSVSFMRES